MNVNSLTLDPVLVNAGLVALGFLVLDAVFGILLALKSHTLSLQKLPGVVEGSIAQCGAGLGVGVLASSLLTGGLQTVSSDTVLALAAAVVARALADIGIKARALLGL